MKNAYGQKIYAREYGENFILIAGDGVVTCFEPEDPTVYPVGSSVSAHYDHPDGIVLSERDVKTCGIEFE